jgi:hypothetical protein
MSHLMSRDELANIQKGHFATPRIVDLALPLALAPAVEQVHSPAPDAGEIFQGFL